MDHEQVRSPWRFLSPLHAKDASDCELVSLTRADELRIVTDMVSASRVSLLYAFSGNGKSSLINAGVVPHFHRLGYAVFKTRPRPPWSNYNPVRAFKDCLLHDMELPLFSQDEVVELREARDQAEALGDHAVHGIASVLDRLEAKISRFRLRSPAPEDFLVRLQSKLDGPLVQFLAEIRDYLGAETRMLFVCDQFEELFVHYNNSPELDEFVAQLAEVWAESSLKVHFLFSMREDWVGSMIAFRKVIPEIFVNYYKLAPLGRKRAADVLTVPIERLHLSWEPGAVEAVLNDLVLSYSRNQTNRFNGVDLTPSPAEDPYIELPALQVVADRFWRTRDQHHPPFTLEHYQLLAGSNGVVAEECAPGEEPEEAVSPAQTVLDSYLLDQLCQIQDDGVLEPRVLQELRLDLLYLLTDRTRHRRALTETGLLTEVRQLRPRELDLPKVDRNLLDQAIRPLIQMRVVTEHETPDRQKQYELAHDFAVRSVVREWRRLDQERVAELALLRRDREKKDKQLEGLVAREIQQLKFLRIAPLTGILGLSALQILFPVFLGFELMPLGNGLVMVLLGSVVALAGSARQKWSLVSGIMGITGVIALSLGYYLTPLVFWEMASVTFSMLSFIFYSRSLISLNELIGKPERVRRLERIMSVEFFDGLIMLILLIGIFLVENRFDYTFADTVSLAVIVFLIWLLASAWVLSRWRRTVGSAFCRLSIETEEGDALPLRRAAVRQLLFLAWSVVNIIPVLFLVITPVMIWKSAKRQNFYDTWVKAVVRELPPRTPVTPRTPPLPSPPS